MIWEFYKYEKEHGKKTTAYDVNLNGESRTFIFCNDPPKQRIAHCQKCGTKIPREVPRLKLDASYYYGAGYYCLSCGVRMLEEKAEDLKDKTKTIQKTVKELEELVDISDKVMQDEFYSKKMALARMIQVMTGEDTK